MAPVTENSVLEANRRFYDTIASSYDNVDSRRGGKVAHSWLDNVLADLIQRCHSACPGGVESIRFLDAGSGSGFLSYQVQKLFTDITMVDISQAMLDRVNIPGAKKICSDCNHIPVSSSSYDLVGAFATLHHLYSPEDLFREAFRILAPGGVFYSDHDIEYHFVKHFRLPLKLYRSVMDHGKKYLALNPSASAEDYQLSEFHGDTGLNGEQLAASLKRCGFKNVQLFYHWQGMGPVTRILDALGITRWLSKKGLAPVVRIVAEKG